MSKSGMTKHDPSIGKWHIDFSLVSPSTIRRWVDGGNPEISRHLVCKMNYFIISIELMELVNRPNWAGVEKKGNEKKKRQWRKDVHRLGGCSIAKSGR